ncbi:hypothetical protein JCM24511_05225 [Saitozyma sp. JCM 24511]|nr:hypothetical protein JCM24511_05225 [Saitozyma sp. JCM 24511]
MVRPAGLLSNRYKLEDMPDLTGKVAVVVGGSRGIGEAATAALIKKGAEVHIVSATGEHASDAVEHIDSTTPASDVRSRLHTHLVDLGDLPAVISLFQRLAGSLPRLDMLFLIAGIGVAPFGLTKSGLGNHFGVNNVSQLAITDVLYPLLKKTAEEKQGKSEEERLSTRIVSESSELHRGAPSDVKFESLEEMAEDKGAMKLYGMSKLGNILFIRHLSSLLPPLTSPSPILALSVHPGAVGTEQQAGASEAYGPLLGGIVEKAGETVFMTKEQGAESALWAGTGASAVGRAKEAQGRYFTEADGKVDTESNQAKDDALAQRFWDLAVRALKEKAGYDVKLGTSCA